MEWPPAVPVLGLRGRGWFGAKDTKMSDIVFRVTGSIEQSRGVTRAGAALEADDPFAGERAEGRVTSVRLGGFRSGEATHELRATDRDLVVVQVAGGGPELILHPETARVLFQAQAGTTARAGGDPHHVEVPTALAWPTMRATGQDAEDSSVAGAGADRGAVKDAVGALFSVVKDKASDILQGGLGGLVGGQLGELLAPGLAEKVGGAIGRLTDSKVDEGVYTLSRSQTWPLKGRRSEVEIAAGSKPHLVLIHGTFVDTGSTFGDLWVKSAQATGMLFDTFEGVHALDHATLGRSPIQNALTLARAFGVGARLHLLTHSRGGLVAEVLVRAAAARGNTAEADAYQDDEGKPGPARGELEELIRLLRDRQISVERVTRVACPVWGTLLASDRLDAYVSVLRWALKLSGVPGEPLLDFVQAVAATRANPAILPGLEAMRPGSALIRWVNGGETTDSSLRVIAGDVRGDTLLGWVKVLVGDSFFWTDNDLVVQTRSMYGGVPRAPESGLYRLFSNGKATHFTYFKNPDVVFPIFSALLEEKPRGFESIGPESRAGAGGSGVRAALEPAYPAEQPDKPIVFVLPGILGSHLRVGPERIWLSHRIVGGLDRIEYPRHLATPDGVVESSYAELIRFLRRSHHVVTFSYDWRKPIEEEAARLGEQVQVALDVRASHQKPVRFLAHSMGGLIVRTFMLECPELWQRVLAHAGARFVMLGTPNAGSWVPMQVFTGDDDFGNMLAFAGSPFESQKGRGLMARMPGFVQLQAGLTTKEIGTAAAWRRLEAEDSGARVSLWHKFTSKLGLEGWALPSEEVLARGKRLRERLDGQIKGGRFEFAERTSLVVGAARRTPAEYQSSSARGLEYVEVIEGGDGRVTHDSACLPGVPTWQVRETHGKLADAASHFAAYEEILQTGTTTKLETFSRAQRDGSAQAYGRVLVRPSRLRRPGRPPSSLEEMLAPRAEAAPPIADVPELRVSVQTGDLRFVAQPLLIGHYSSLTLSGAEAVVDGYLGGSMQRYLQTRAYPSEPGESTTFPNRRRPNPFRLPRPEGVVVVGLGNESSLRPLDLQKTVTRGVLNWVKTLVHSERAVPDEVSLASTLVGSGGLGISTEVSARSIALGVQRANERLRAIGWPVVTTLTLVEIYKGRAREAHAAVSMLTEIEGHRIRVDSEIDPGLGAKWGYADGSYRGANYDLVSIENVREGATGSSAVLQTLRYAVSTRRARTEVESHPVQGVLIEQLIKGGVDGSAVDPRIGSTLFRMLVPLSMTELLVQSSRLVLELDPGVAGIPWEVLTGDGGPEGIPWAISCKLVRKLRIEGYRARPRDSRLDDAVLVISEPRCDETKYPRLPGARNEARAVVREVERRVGIRGAASGLDSGASGTEAQGGVFAVEDADAASIVHELNARPYRIIHVAGHGEPGEKCGVVLSGGAFLGPREIRDLREVPELVFINCCHLGTRSPAGAAEVQSGRPAFAASVAEALINIGVKCVVAAGWAVDDVAASSFAAAFYRTLFAGGPFSDAVAEGRRAARAAAPSSMTWAAYQCYGDPEWTFVRAAHADSLNDAETMAAETVTSSDELVARLEDLAVDCRFKAGDPSDLAPQPGGVDLRRELRLLEHLERRYAEQYGPLGRVAQAFADAYKFAGQSAEALRWYARAARAEDGQASLCAMEQWANLQVRVAWNGIRNVDEPTQAAVEAALQAISEAKSCLETLVSIHGTSERHSLLGSALRRRMLVERKAGREFWPSLRQSTEHYERALASAPLDTQFYPAMNVIINRAALGLHELALMDPKIMGDVVALARASLETKMVHAPDFFAAVGQIEVDLYSALLEGTLTPDLAQSIRTRLRDDIHARVGSVHEWRSVRDSAQLVFWSWPDSQELKDILGDLEAYAAALP